MYDTAKVGYDQGYEVCWLCLVFILLMLCLGWVHRWKVVPVPRHVLPSYRRKLNFVVVPMCVVVVVVVLVMYGNYLLVFVCSVL